MSLIYRLGGGDLARAKTGFRGRWVRVGGHKATSTLTVCILQALPEVLDGGILRGEGVLGVLAKPLVDPGIILRTLLVQALLEGASSIEVTQSDQRPEDQKKNGWRLHGRGRLVLHNNT